MTPPPTMTTRDVEVGGDVETIARNCIAATRPFRSPKGREQAQPKGPTPERVCPSATCHSERTRTVIPSDTELSFRAKPNCHSKRSRTVIPSGHELSFRAKPNCHSERSRTVIPSEAELSFRADTNCHSERSRTVIPSEAELSFQAKPNCHSERTRTVIPSEAELSFRAKPRNLTASHRDAASDSSLRCALFRMT